MTADGRDLASRSPGSHDASDGEEHPRRADQSAGRVDVAALVERSAGLQPWRRLFHATFGLTLVALVEGLDLPAVPVLTALAAILAAQLVLDAVRLAVPSINLLFFRAFIRLTSPRESQRIASSTWYVLGALVSLALFPRTAAVGGILVLALADPAANIVGRRWGRTRLGSDGTVEGTATFLATAFLVLLVVAAPPVAAPAAVAATLVERMPVPLDDNLTIPLATSAALWGLGVA